VRPGCTIGETAFLIYNPKELILDALQKYRNVAIKVAALENIFNYFVF